MKLRNILLFFALLTSLFASAVNINGIEYRLNTENKTAEISIQVPTYDASVWPSDDIVKKFSGDIIIPESFVYEGVDYTVNSVGNFAFRFCKFITSITLPKSITDIGECAFQNCSGLLSFIVPSKVKNIKWGTFDNCSSITSLTIPENIEDIEGGAFRNCTGLTAMTFNCKKVPSILWENTYIKKVVFGDNVKTIESGAFRNCISITSLIIPNGISSIGEMAFKGCSGLSSLTIGNSIEILNSDVFNGCTGLTSIIIPDGVKTIQECAFDNCSAIENITIGGSVEEIEGGAFGHINKLKSVKCLPNNIRYVSQWAFDGTDTNNATLFVPTKTKKDYSAKEVWSNFGNILPIDGKYLLSYKVDGDEYSEYEIVEGSDISPEDSPTKEGREFSGWSNVPAKMPSEDVTVTGSFKYNIKYMIDGAEYKTVGVFYNDVITAEENPTKKGTIFSGWTAIPEKMPAKDIEVTGTFSWSTATKDNIIYQVNDATNNTCSVIGYDNAGEEIKIASSVVFDESYKVSTIKAMAFKKKSDLKKIELPATLTKIEERAFADLDKLADVTIWAENVPETDRTAFENSYIEDYVTLHVPASALEKYKATAPWKNFKEIVAISDTDIDDTDVDVITIKSYGKGTYCSDYDLDFSYTDNLKAFIVTGYDHKTNTIWLTRVKSVPAGTGIIVKGTPGDYKVKHVESLSVYANFLVGTTEDKKIKDVEDGMTNFVLSKGEWYRFDGEITLPKGMAYLPLPLSKFAGTRSLIEVYENNDEGTTEIRTIEQGTMSSEHDVWFTLQGQRLDKPRKGLYIRNGKKVVVR